MPLILNEIERLENIASHHGLTIQELLKINQVSTPYEIEIGSTIEVPTSVIDAPLQPYIPYYEYE
ncbi:LysM peptidoglycan-binding domain-containing protein [Staphylococcus nepalensis]|uniref:LysM peptidoglycan-binding domain-containing protein n=1 Tax=Staphylococcus nepalensis TaxID=214473 RepID=UPI00227200E2|nr:LysM peptidoglycan-binding domain-containing protein [Staphylococcus nepalensis]MCY1039158.1 LysM peptidoglycan-binding domain-containing protein [Staphylococcus nepalensis]